MTSIYYYDEQDLSGFRFLVLIRAFVIQTSLGLQNLNMKGKKKRILVEVVKCANINGRPISFRLERGDNRKYTCVRRLQFLLLIINALKPVKS